jgi:hypothetical protein
MQQHTDYPINQQGGLKAADQAAACRHLQLLA